MSDIKNCPDCGQDLHVKAKACKCGWKQKDADKFSYACCAIEDWGRCNSTVECRRINVGSEPPLFWCFHHAERFRKKTGIEKEIDERAKVYAQGARMANMSNYEFCKEIMEGYGIKFKNGVVDEKSVGKAILDEIAN